LLTLLSNGPLWRFNFKEQHSLGTHSTPSGVAYLGDGFCQTDVFLPKRRLCAFFFGHTPTNSTGCGARIVLSNPTSAVQTNGCSLRLTAFAVEEHRRLFSLFIHVLDLFYVSVVAPIPFTIHGLDIRQVVRDTK